MIKKQGTILIVDDNRNILTTVRMLLEPIFDGIITIANPNSIPAKLREEHPDVVLLDMNFSSGINSGNEGLYWLREIKSLSPKTEVVLFTRLCRHPTCRNRHQGRCLRLHREAF